ncbi:MAG: HAMP domain-containing sensor histidine kinase [Streptosporangiaceae bacterium]
MMPDPRPGRGSVRRLLPSRSARLRLTVLYGAAFVVCGACGAAVIAVTFALYGHLAPQVHPQRAAGTAGVRPGTSFTSAPARAAPGVHVTVAGLGQVNLGRQQLLVISVSVSACFLVTTAALGWLLAGRVLRPLSTITAAARRISASSLHERLALHGPDDELKELADTLDSLFTRLEASFEAQRRFAANASHELRTPLTRERTLLQVTLADPDATPGIWQAVGRKLLASNAETESLIEALLILASSEVGSGEREPLDLAAIAGAVVEAARPTAGRLTLQVQADTQPAPLDGDPLLLHQLAANLIDNAVRHNVPGGDIQVATGTSHGRAVLSVANSGPSIPPAEVERLFQPFQRLGPRRACRDGGHGLGLSIVRAIATAHAAAITARPRPGGGLAIDVTFPPPTRRPV